MGRHPAARKFAALAANGDEAELHGDATTSSEGSSAHNLDLAGVFEELVDALRELRHAVDPSGPMRPLSIAEAAKAMRCRRSEVENLLETGALPFIDRKGRRYLLPSDISQWLRRETVRNLPKTRRNTKGFQTEDEDIDPALREFFD